MGGKIVKYASIPSEFLLSKVLGEVPTRSVTPRSDFNMDLDKKSAMVYWDILISEEVVDKHG